jgi:hypothetical protein
MQIRGNMQLYLFKILVMLLIILLYLSLNETILMQFR